MTKLSLRHWSHVSSFLVLKNATCHATKLPLAQNCRYMSKKEVIRWPKAIPRPDQSQTSSKKLTSMKKNREKHFPKSSPVNGGRSEGTIELAIEGIVNSEANGYEDEFMSEEIEETDLELFNNSEQTAPLHFSETDLGMKGTFVVKGRNTDRVLEDLETSQLVIDKSNMVNKDGAHGSDDGGMGFGERVSDVQTMGEGSSQVDVLKASKDETDAFDRRLHGRMLPQEDDGDEEIRKSIHGGNTSLIGEELLNGECFVSSIDKWTNQNIMEGRKQSWKEIPLLKRQSQSKQKQKLKKHHIDPKNEVLFGISPCHLALLNSRRQIVNAFVLEAFEMSARPEAQEIMKMLSSKGVKIHVRNRGELNRLSQDRPHQGVCLEVSRLHFENLADISGELITADVDSRMCLLALDKIMDPMNLGALMRSAYFLGVDVVVTNKPSCCPLTPIVSKASSGICEVMPIYSAMDMVKFVGELAVHGWHIMGATNEPSTGQVDPEKPTLPCTDVKLSKPTALVIGSEGFGLRKSIQALCQTFVTVPPGRTLHVGIDSLNVSVATGILLHSLLVNR